MALSAREPSAEASGDIENIDGRSARRDRNRTAVLDAVIELFSEDNLAPGPEEVALRVGLSARSVYRYFEDRDALVRSAIERHLEILRPLFAIEEFTRGSFEERLERFMASRMGVYEVGAASFRASVVRSSFDSILKGQLEANHRAMRHQVDAQFAIEIDSTASPRRDAVAAAVDALTQFESIDQYRIHRGLSAEETSALLTRALRILLAP